MKRLKTTLSIVFLLSVSASVLSQKSDGTDGTILLGLHYGFILKGPDGWLIDSAARPEGSEAVLYREGSSWKNAVAVMYVRVIYKNEMQATVEKVISNDVSDFLKQSRETKAWESPNLATRDKKQAVVKGFYDAPNKNHELVAFIDEPKVVVILVLSSRDKDEFEKSLPAFKALVGSYFFVKELVDPR